MYNDVRIVIIAVQLSEKRKRAGPHHSIRSVY